MRWDVELPRAPRRPRGEGPSLTEAIRIHGHALRRLPEAIRQDATVEMAAGMSFFMLFSIFPGLVFVATFLPFLPPDLANLDAAFDLARPLLPGEVYSLLHDDLTSLVTQPRGGLAFVSVAITLFSASRALVSLSRALNRAYGVPAQRPEWLRRLRSMVLTVGVLFGFLVAVFGLTLGNRLVQTLVEHGWLDVGPSLLILAVRWPLLFVLATFFVQQLYYLLPDRRPRWRPVSSGAVLAVMGWVVATSVFTRLAASFLESNLAYGSLGSVAVVMAWLYLGCLALVLGASLNALVESAALAMWNGEGKLAEKER